MTDRQDWGQPPRYPQRDYDQHEQRDNGRYPRDQSRPFDYPQDGPGHDQRQDQPWPPQQYDQRQDQRRPQQQYDSPQDKRWQPQPYDPVAHQQRISGPQYGEQPDWERPPREAYPPRDPYPPQEDYPPERPYPPQEDYPPENREYPPSWAARHKVLTGLIVIVALIVIGAIVKEHKNTATPGADTGSASSCLTQLSSWSATGGKERISALSSDMSALGKATGKLNASKTATSLAAARTAAASVRSGASAVEGDAGPSCVPSMRTDLLAAAHDYSQSASDATKGVSQLTAGDDSKAVTVMDAANTASKSGEAKLAAATKAATGFSAGN